jgi:hypothetical protein
MYAAGDLVNLPLSVSASKEPLRERASYDRSPFENTGESPLQRFALQARNSEVFITQLWGIIPISLFRNTEDDDRS